MTNALILRPEVPERAERLQPALEADFLAVQAAIAADRPVAFVVPAEDLLGARSPAGAAYVNALLGLCRAVAFEGAKHQWRIVVVAAPGAEVEDGAVEDLVATPGLSGQVITLGSGLVGRIVP